MMRITFLAITLIFICSNAARAQTRDWMPIPPAAAELLASLHRAESLEEIKSSYVAVSFPLRDGVETLVVEGRGVGPCGAANCQTYILEGNGTTYKLLLNAHAVQQIHMLNSVTNGYHDIQTDRHGSAIQSDLFIYRYDGKQYRLSECLSREYSLDVDEKGEPKVSEKPVITRIACGK